MTMTMSLSSGIIRVAKVASSAVVHPDGFITRSSSGSNSNSCGSKEDGTLHEVRCAARSGGRQDLCTSLLLGRTSSRQRRRCPPCTVPRCTWCIRKAKASRTRIRCSLVERTNTDQYLASRRVVRLVVVLPRHVEQKCARGEGTGGGPGIILREGRV